METPNAPITANAPQTGTGNYKIAAAFLCSAAMATYLALNALAGLQFNTIAWLLPLAPPLAMSITGWNTGRQLTPEEERQQADISRWDV